MPGAFKAGQRRVTKRESSLVVVPNRKWKCNGLAAQLPTGVGYILSNEVRCQAWAVGTVASGIIQVAWLWAKYEVETRKFADAANSCTQVRRRAGRQRWRGGMGTLQHQPSSSRSAVSSHIA